jgi:hypothetical protein
MTTFKVALTCLLVVVAGGGVPSHGAIVYLETFDNDEGTFVITNGSDPSAGWAFDASCPPATSAPAGAGVLRWGEFQDCFSYGQLGHTDEASTPPVSLLACTLSFNYHLDYEEPVTFENADVEVTWDGTSGTLLSLADGTLMSSASWINAQTALPNGEVSVQFIASTDDGTFNSGTGWSIDDVAMICDTDPAPATSRGGVFVLIAGFSLAMAWMLARRRAAISDSDLGN